MICRSIETLAMAYLDDELAPEERRELELHLPDCAACRAHVDAERADLELLRKALAPPPAPGALRVQVERALDAEDREVARFARRRSMSSVGRWLLPGAATLAAAAAMAVFALLPPPQEEVSPRGSVAREAVRQKTRSLPLEVQGAGTAPWLRQHLPTAEPPQFTEPGIELLGARLTSVAGRDAALIRYGVSVGANLFELTAFVIVGLDRDALTGGVPVTVRARSGERTLYIHNADGIPAVTYVDEVGTGYMFAADRLTPQELVSLVVSSDLIGRAQQGR